MKPREVIDPATPARPGACLAPMQPYQGVSGHSKYGSGGHRKIADAHSQHGMLMHASHERLGNLAVSRLKRVADGGVTAAAANTLPPPFTAPCNYILLLWHRLPFLYPVS